MYEETNREASLVFKLTQCKKDLKFYDDLLENLNSCNAKFDSISIYVNVVFPVETKPDHFCPGFIDFIFSDDKSPDINFAKIVTGIICDRIIYLQLQIHRIEKELHSLTSN